MHGQGYKYDHELNGEDWEAVVGEFKKISGKMPQAPDEQLEMAICAVFSSWFTPRAVRYRCVDFDVSWLCGVHGGGGDVVGRPAALGWID